MIYIYERQMKIVFNLIIYTGKLYLKFITTLERYQHTPYILFIIIFIFYSFFDAESRAD